MLFLPEEQFCTLQRLNDKGKVKEDILTIINYLDIHYPYGPSRVIVSNLLKEAHHQKFLQLAFFFPFQLNCKKTPRLCIRTDMKVTDEILVIFFLMAVSFYCVFSKYKRA